MGQIAKECQLDVELAEQARALHRVVRAMHDGHCPACGYLSSSDAFYFHGGLDPSMSVYDANNVARESRHECPSCHFAITQDEAEAALAEFRPFLQKSVEVFENWRRDKHAINPT